MKACLSQESFFRNSLCVGLIADSGFLYVPMVKNSADNGKCVWTQTLTCCKEGHRAVAASETSIQMLTFSSLATWGSLMTSS